MSISTRLDRAIQLLRYHKPAQLFHRARKMAQNRLRRLKPFRPRLLSGSCRLRQESIATLSMLAEQRCALWPHRNETMYLSDLVGGRYTFLNETRSLGDGSHVDWNPDAPRLWRFHLQSQEYLLHLAHAGHADVAWQIVNSWLQDPRHQSPSSDPDAWHPFCISRRLPGWLMLAAISPAPNSCDDIFWRSTLNQIVWLQKNLETDLGGNHLLENLRALSLADCFVEGDFKINSTSLHQHICRELNEQVLPSGEHFERAPTYHAIMQFAVQEMAIAYEASRTPERATPLRLAWQKMHDFLQSIVHPDGQVPLFADSVFEETPLPLQLHEYALASGIISEASGDSVSRDYFVVGQGGDKLIVDFGPLACDHLPAHGHADLFTFEASLRGKRVIVDAGTYDYEESQMRQFCRGTTGHNVLQIDDANHCDIWSRFRMGSRGRPIHRDSGEIDNAEFSATWQLATHNAFRHLGVSTCGRVVVSIEQAEAAVNRGAEWVVLDWFRSQNRHRATNRLHFHPDVSLSHESEKELLAKIVPDGGPKTEYLITLLGSGVGELSEGWFCPDFGQRYQTQVALHHQTDVESTWLGWHIRARESCSSLAVEQTSTGFTLSWSQSDHQQAIQIPVTLPHSIFDSA